MTLQANTVDKEKDTRRAGNFLVAMNDAFWCPYRLAVKTFLEGQKDALSHLTTIRNLLDEMRDTMRREQDIALGVCQKTFEEIGVRSGLAYNEDGREQAGMGVAVGDYNLDGSLDIFKTHFSDDTNVLYRNDGNGNFDDVTIPSGFGVETRYICWGTGFADFDNNGWPDLAAAERGVDDVGDQLVADGQ
jgi:hypothetical protein